MKYVLLTLALLASGLQAQTVYVDSNTDVATAQFVVWSWKLRSGMNVTYGGISSNACENNAIIIRKAYAGEWPYPPGSVQASTGVCGTGGYRAYYPTSITLQAMSHELGHALENYVTGADPLICSPHTCDPGALMFSNPAIWAISQADITRGTPRWPVVNTPNLCYVELQPNLDLYVPEIAGYRVMLKYNGIVGGQHTWINGNTTTNPAPQGCTTATLSGNTATLTDVKGYPNLHYSAVLVSGPSGWTATSITPI